MENIYVAKEKVSIKTEPHRKASTRCLARLAVICPVSRTDTTALRHGAQWTLPRARDAVNNCRLVTEWETQCSTYLPILEKYETMLEDQDKDIWYYPALKDLIVVGGFIVYAREWRFSANDSR